VKRRWGELAEEERSQMIQMAAQIVSSGAGSDTHGTGIATLVVG